MWQLSCAALPALATAISSGSSSATQSQSPPAWNQDAFFISFWVGPQVEADELDFRFAEIAEANFTGYLGFNGNSKSPFRPNSTRVEKEIELCDKHGLRCVPSNCGPVWTVEGPCLAMGKGSKNFWGFQLLDEVGAFAKMGAWQEQLQAARPGALNFFNLLGDTPFPSPDAYSAYVNSFVTQVHPQVISMDFYPQFPQTLSVDPPDFPASGLGEAGVRSGSRRLPQSKDEYGESLAVLRQQAELAPGGPIPWWCFFNAMPYDRAHTDPTEAMMKWQAMTALTYGASGVMYFCYWSPLGVFELGGGLVVPRGTPVRRRNHSTSATDLLPVALCLVRFL